MERFLMKIASISLPIVFIMLIQVDPGKYLLTKVESFIQKFTYFRRGIH